MVKFVRFIKFLPPLRVGLREIKYKMNSTRKMLQVIPEDPEVLVLQVKRVHARMPFLGEVKSVRLSYSGLSGNKGEFKGVLLNEWLFGWLLGKEEQIMTKAEGIAREIYRHYLFKGVKVIIEGVRNLNLAGK